MEVGKGRHCGWKHTGKRGREKRKKAVHKIFQVIYNTIYACNVNFYICMRNLNAIRRNWRNHKG